MQNESFEWDDAKASFNIRKHGVSFEAACGVFADAFAVEFEDDRQDCGEPGFITIGMVERRLLFVVSAVRESRIRLISARQAEPREARRYHEQNKT